MYGNVLASLELSAPYHTWVSNLTYVATDEGFLYVSLISVAWSRRIVGYEGSHTLAASGSLKALQMARKQLPKDAGTVHHSDRGIQYACRAYVKTLQRRGLRVSMTEENHCYENAQAERLNGILKQVYGLAGRYRTRAEAVKVLRQAVELYNTRRPPISLGYRTPETVHGAVA
ncbi:DDE-type integrase/transposase/recombinase [bacterium]|nr:DDE-type integrase/transposase/recombinase [bacterium]